MQPFSRRQCGTPGPLQTGQAQRAAGAGHRQDVIQRGARRHTAPIRYTFRRQHPDTVAVMFEPGAWPRVKRPHVAFQLRRRKVPVEPGFFAGKLFRVVGAVFGLRYRMQRARCDAVEGLIDEPRTQRRQSTGSL